MALTDWAMRAAGYRARPPALASSRPPLGALANPSFNGMPHQPLWPAYEGPQAVRVGNRNVYAARCIERIANDISGLPFYAGNMKSKTPRPTTAMQQLLGPAPGSPNPQWSAAKLWNYTARQWLILGKYAWLHEYNDAGKIIALWPLMAQYVVPVVAPVGAPGYFEEFRYGTVGSPGYRVFKPGDLTYVWNPSDEDVRLPRAPLALANWGIKISQLLDAYDDAFLSNGGVPAYLVTTPSFADQKSRVTFRDQFRRRFGGPSNANKALFAETDVEPGEVGTVPSSTQSVSVQVIGTSQKDAQLDVLRNNRIADMCVAFGVPLSILGNSADAKFTNMATDRTNYWRDTVGGHIRTLADGLNTAFGPLVDGPQDIGWFDTSNVPEMRRPPVFDAHEGLAAVAAGTITLNEYRADRGLDKLTDPDADVAKPRPTAVLRLSDVLSNGADPTAALAAADQAVAGTDGAPDTKTPAKAAPPAAPSPKRADAVRTDLLGVVRGQLAVELADQAAELRARIEGKRGGRKRAHAGLDLGLAYEADHWRERMARNLGPALAAAGVREPDGWSEDITSAVFESISGLTPEDPWQASFGVDEVLGRLRPLAPATLLLDGV